MCMCFFYFKQKTAYEMRISDWSSDVCSSDLPRLGPRPLPLHLMAAGLTWASSRSALPLWNSGSLPLNGKLGKGKLGKGELAERAAALRASLDGTEVAIFAEAVEREVAGRVAALAAGVEAYRRHPYRRDLPEPPVLWQEGRSEERRVGEEWVSPGRSGGAPCTKKKKNK